MASRQWMAVPSYPDYVWPGEGSVCQVQGRLRIRGNRSANWIRRRWECDAGKLLFYKSIELYKEIFSCTQTQRVLYLITLSSTKYIVPQKHCALQKHHVLKTNIELYENIELCESIEQLWPAMLRSHLCFNLCCHNYYCSNMSLQQSKMGTCPSSHTCSQSASMKTRHRICILCQGKFISTVD